jgi:hypothetical protein
MRAVLLCLLLLGLPGLASAAPPAAAAKSPVRIQVESPHKGEPISNKVDQAPIRGNAMTEGDKPAAFDVIIAIDVSGSTEMAWSASTRSSSCSSRARIRRAPSRPIPTTRSSPPSWRRRMP